MINKKNQSKEDLYFERIQNKNHKEIRFVDSNFFRTKNPLQELRKVGKEFNKIVEYETNGIEYSVILKYGITKISADFEYQYIMFRKFIRNNGIPHYDILQELKLCGAYALKNCIFWKNATGEFAMRRNIFEELIQNKKDEEKLSPSEFILLSLYKAFSSTPNKASNGSEGGITGLSDIRASELLSCTSKTIQRNRIKLMNKGLVEEIYFDGRFRKLRINI